MRTLLPSSLSETSTAHDNRVATTHTAIVTLPLTPEEAFELEVDGPYILRTHTEVVEKWREGVRKWYVISKGFQTGVYSDW